jgi:hypothetical protein
VRYSVSYIYHYYALKVYFSVVTVIPTGSSERVHEFFAEWLADSLTRLASPVFTMAEVVTTAVEAAEFFWLDLQAESCGSVQESR